MKKNYRVMITHRHSPPTIVDIKTHLKAARLLDEAVARMGAPRPASYWRLGRTVVDLAEAVSVEVNDVPLAMCPGPLTFVGDPTLIWGTPNGDSLGSGNTTLDLSTS